MTIFRTARFPSGIASKNPPKASSTLETFVEAPNVPFSTPKAGASQGVETGPQGGLEPEGRLFYPHLKKYALVSSTISTVDQFPFVHDFSLKWKPVLEAAIESQPIKFFADQFDPIGEATLNTIDRFAPSLKNVEVVDLTDPVVSRINATLAAVERSFVATASVIDERIINPTLQKADATRSRVIATFTNANGKCVVTVPFDPVVGPVNKNLESLVATYLPGTKKVPKEGQSSEISRTLQLVSNVLTRTREPEVSIEDPAIAAPGPTGSLGPVERGSTHAN